MERKIQVTQYNSLMSSRIWSNVGWNFKTSPNARSFSTVYTLMSVCECVRWPSMCKKGRILGA